MGNEDITGDIMLGLWAAKGVFDCYQTNEAAKSEGITYEEMRLREKAARYRARANGTTWQWRKRRNEARANSCDEQLARFETTRNKKEDGALNNNTTTYDVVNNTSGQGYCNQCGAAGVEGARFCGTCGTKIHHISCEKDEVDPTIVLGEPIQNCKYTAESHAYNPNFYQSALYVK